jgi:hypothetical protein
MLFVQNKPQLRLKKLYTLPSSITHTDSIILTGVCFLNYSLLVRKDWGFEKYGR